VSNGLPDMFHQIAPAKTGGRLYGVVAGVVADNADPEKRGRVKIKLSWLLDGDGKEYVTGWARTLAPGAGGPGRGLLLPFAVGDEVLVAFNFGNPADPYVLGGLWSKDTDQPPAYPFQSKAEVNLDRRVLRSKSGHAVVLDDTEGEESITIADPKGQKIVLDTKNGGLMITVESQLSIRVGSGAEAITITAAKGKVTIECEELALLPSQRCTVDLGEGGTTIDVEKSKLAMRSGKVTINDPALEVI
jgi:uncharacterized protein involved in type VI secretion and phage assembly